LKGGRAVEGGGVAGQLKGEGCRTEEGGGVAEHPVAQPHITPLTLQLGVILLAVQLLATKACQAAPTGVANTCQPTEQPQMHLEKHGNAIYVTA